MIGQLTGLLIEQNENDRCLIDVNGVGYVVFASSRSLLRFSRPPEVARVLIETIVREDAILLYGFADVQERDCFRMLTTVQGVGVRMALSILSALSSDELVLAIMSGDKASLTRASGVGARLALRIITELGNKVANLSDKTLSTSPSEANISEQNILRDALLALEGLGFRRLESQPIISRIIKRLESQNDKPELDIILREALRELAR